MRTAFHSREEAGRALADRLAPYADRDPVVFALPRGGVPVAAEIARALHAPLDLLFVRKIGLPWQPELAYAAHRRRQSARDGDQRGRGAL